MPHTDNENAIKLAENFFVNIRRLAIRHEASSIFNILTVSIGVATMQKAEQVEPRALINAADLELWGEIKSPLYYWIS